MKLLLDENLSPRLIDSIAKIYPGSRHVESCGLRSATDDEVWRYALSAGFAIVSKESDFSERSVLDGSPPKVVWLRTGNCTTNEAALLMIVSLPRIKTFLMSETETCLVLSIPSRRS